MIANSHELDFWKKFIHSDQFATWLTDKKTPELDPWVYEFLTTNPGNVLDVGSGAVSVLHGTVPQKNLIACDILGRDYEKIFDYKKYNITPPDPFAGEHLPYASNFFDHVHIRNAIDHCEDPIQVLNEMIRVCKPGGFVIVQGFEDEAEHEKYQGLHQWNMRMTSEGLLYFLNKTGNMHFQGDCEIHHFETRITPKKRNWILWVIRKSEQS